MNPQKKPLLWGFACLVFLFSLHRSLILPALEGNFFLSQKIKFVTFSLGLASDFWVACLVTLIFSLFFFWLPRAFQALSLLALGMLLAFHVPYVYFFRVTFRRVHLPYVFDPSFVSSSLSSFWQWRSLLQVLASAVAAWFFFQVTKAPKGVGQANQLSKIGLQSFNSRRAFFVSIFFLFLSGILSNFISNRYARKFDLSEKMVQNVLVAFVFDALDFHNRFDALQQSQGRINELSQALLPDFHAQQTTGAKASKPFFDQKYHPVFALANNELMTDQQPKSAIGDPQSQLQTLVASLRPEFSPQTLQSSKRYYFVFLMESARAVESKLMFPALQGQMPQLDLLIGQNSIVFPRGYSTGTVSRSGAESTACNALSSVYFNAMRNVPLAAPQCAAEIFGPGLKSSSILSSFYWVHGGFPTFDGQGDFWDRNRFQSPINALVSKNLPQTGWGLSDKAFFKEASTWLDRHKQQSQKGLTFASFVTISNHTAWALPQDASPEVREFTKTARYPHWGTTRYADEALAEFVDELKKKQIWDQSVVLFLGDHGMEEPSELLTSRSISTAVAEPQNQNLLDANLLTNVYFALSGGLVEKSVLQCRQAGLCPTSGPLIFQNAVSQADVLPTLADLLQGPDHPFFGVSLFKTSRKYSVFADLGEDIYLPGAYLGDKSRIYKKRSFLQSKDIETQDYVPSNFYLLYLILTQQGEFARLMRLRH